jgi:hypothetical protein
MTNSSHSREGGNLALLKKWVMQEVYSLNEYYADKYWIDGLSNGGFVIPYGK